MARRTITPACKCKYFRHMSRASRRGVDTVYSLGLKRLRSERMLGANSKNPDDSLGRYINRGHADFDIRNQLRRLDELRGSRALHVTSLCARGAFNGRLKTCSSPVPLARGTSLTANNFFGTSAIGREVVGSRTRQPTLYYAASAPAQLGGFRELMPGPRLPWRKENSTPTHFQDPPIDHPPARHPQGIWGATALRGQRLSRGILASRESR